MTVIDQPPTPSPAESSRSPGDGPAPRGRGILRPVRKPAADVVDLFIMNALETSAAPPVSARDAAEGNDLLDALVQAHLERAETESDVPEAVSPVTDAAVETPPVLTPPAEGELGGADLLQREIDALLGAPGEEPSLDAPQPVPAAPASAAASSAAISADELQVLLMNSVAAPEVDATNVIDAASVQTVELPSNTLPAAAEAIAGEGISNDELAALMAELTDAPAEAPAAPAAQRMEIADVDDEVAATFNDAEKALAAELAELMAESSAPVAVATAPATVEAEAPAIAVVNELAAASAKALEPETAAAAELPAADMIEPPTVVESPGAPVSSVSPADIPPCVIVELPEEEEEEEEIATESHAAIPLHRRIMSLFNDMGLMIAQLIDMPFAWIDLLDKNLLGVAAIILLLSGAVLKLMAWRWMR